MACHFCRCAGTGGDYVDDDCGAAFGDAVMRSWHADGDPHGDVQRVLRGYWSMIMDYCASLDIYNQIYPSCTAQYREVSVMSSGGNSGEARIIKAISHRENMLASLIAKQQNIDIVEQAVDGLPTDERAVIRLYYMTKPRRRPDEIADALHMSEPTFWRCHRRGIAKLIACDSIRQLHDG